MKRNVTNYRVRKLPINIGICFMVGFILLLLRHNTNTDFIFDTLKLHSAATVFFVFPILYFLIGVAVVEILAIAYNLFGYENFQHRMPNISWGICIWAWPALLVVELSMLLFVNSIWAIQACSCSLRSMMSGIRGS